MKLNDQSKTLLSSVNHSHSKYIRSKLYKYIRIIQKTKRFAFAWLSIFIKINIYFFSALQD